MQYLGFVLSENGVSASTDKVKAVREYRTPINVREVSAFLDLCSFYRRLVSSFAQISKPLTTLTRKDQKFECGPSQMEAFRGLKDKLRTTTVLAFPKFEMPFILTTDVSKLAVKAVLCQVQDDMERPIA